MTIAAATEHAHDLHTYPVAELKALTGKGEQPGTFEAIVSVFGNVDDYGDRMMPGAFEEVLKVGYPPIVWSHNWDVPPIGVTLEAKEIPEGLYVKGRLFVDAEETSDLARAVYTAMTAKGGDGRPALREFSFGFRTGDTEMVEEDGEQVRNIRTVKRLYECGPCLVGVNPATRLLDIKGQCPTCGTAVKGSTKDSTETPADDAGNEADTITPAEQTPEHVARVRELLAER